MNRRSPAKPVDWRPPVSFLPRALREPVRPARTLAVAWATAFFPAIALGAAASALLPDTAMPRFPIADATAFFLVVVAAPVFETLVMAAALLLLRLFLSPTSAVLVSAVGWGAVHSAAAPAWGLVIWWPFLIFSTVFLAWRTRSVAAGIAMAAASHALHNLIPALLLVSGLGR